MKTTPIKNLTMWASITLITIAVMCIPFGWHLIGNITAAAGGVNLAIGALRKGY